MAIRAKKSDDPVKRRLSLFHLRFERYQQVLPEDHIIRYEDLVASGGRALKIISPAAQKLDEPLQSQNTNPLYDRDRMLRLGEKLLESEGAYWDFYTREDVEEILGQLA